MKIKSERKREYREFMPDSINTIPVESLDDLGFFTAPASTKYHGAFEGGLFDHSLEVTKSLVELTEKLGLTWQRPESPYIVGMYHDLCKCDAYRYDIETDRFVWNNDQILDGHGSKSVIVTQQFIDLTDEEIACIRWHMGPYETNTELWNYYGRAIEAFPNVLYTHMADMIASKIRGV